MIIRLSEFYGTSKANRQLGDPHEINDYYTEAAIALKNLKELFPTIQLIQ